MKKEPIDLLMEITGWVAMPTLGLTMDSESKRVRQWGIVGAIITGFLLAPMWMPIFLLLAFPLMFWQMWRDA